MENVLNEILLNKRNEVDYCKEVCSINSLIKKPMFERKTLSLKKRLIESKSGIISEFKRKSPSKGWIYPEADPVVVTSGYCKAGASGISILTDEKYFGGKSDFIVKARQNVNCPILRKEFIIDEYQLYEAKAIGADLVLLIAAALSIEDIKKFAGKAHELGLEVLMEVHNEKELNHINEYVDLIGVNNRNLNNFKTDVNTSFNLVEKIPDDFVKVSESGISNVKTVRQLRNVGYKGFLMGEFFMKEPDPAKALSVFVDKIECNE